jgi:GNAT superfamily N-acetyltransferase
MNAIPQKSDDFKRIREARSSEMVEIMRHRRGMYTDMGFEDATALDAMEHTSEEFIRKAIIDGEYHQWFAETSQSRVIGGVAVLVHPWVSSPTNPRPERAYVLNMYVYPEFRRQGIARELMRTAIEWCRKHRFRSLYLHASENGRRLYEELGFKSTNEMRIEF